MNFQSSILSATVIRMCKGRIQNGFWLQIGSTGYLG